MKTVLVVLLSLALAGCAYTYDVGVKEGVPASEFATMTLPNTIKLTEVDHKEFDTKFSIWVDGSNTIHLAPGPHSFTFRYSDANLRYGGNYTRNFTTLTAILRAGHYYNISHNIRGNRIYFRINDLSDP